MEEKTSSKSWLSKNKFTVVIALVLIALALLITVLLINKSPKRSISAYCSEYKTQKSIIAKSGGETYSSAVFNESSSDTDVFVTAYGKLAKVVPSDVQRDVETLDSVYRKIADDPTQAMSASLSGLSAEDSVAKWTKSHCD